MGQYKLSYYNIFSDSINSKDDKILFCSRTGEAIPVTKEIQEHLLAEEFDHLEQGTFETLLNAKCIVPVNENELETVVEENKAAIEDSGNLYHVIQPSFDCQLGCYYCGQTHTKGNIASSLYSALIERIREKASRRKYSNLEIGWFGSEPLIAIEQIRELTPKLKKIAAEFGMSYTCSVVTNGLSLNAKMYRELANELAVKKIEITLDGTAEYHDKHRFYKAGHKSFDKIFKNLLEICNLPNFHEIECPISVRCNVDKKNWEGVSPLIQKLAEHGLQEKIAYFYPMGVYSWSGNDAQNGSLTKEEFAKKEIDWLIEMYEVGFKPFPLRNRQKQVCMAVSPSSELFDPNGKVYNCTEVSLTPGYEDNYVVGNLKDPSQDKPHDQRPFLNWNDKLLTDEFPCHSCKILPVCGGQCPKSWEEGIRACPTIKFNIKERLALSYVVANSDLAGVN